jgi:hypothetical protein
MLWSRVRFVLVLLTALAAAVFGAVQLLAEQAADPVVHDQMANVDSLNAQVTNVGWTEMDHDMAPDAPGYQMPPAMMPGMPEGDDQRFAVGVTVTNTSSDTRPLRPASEFTLHVGKAGRTVKAQTDTFGELPRLAAQNAVKGVLYFDLPPAELAESPAWLEWTRGDTITRMALPTDTASGDHGHSHN